MTAHLSLRIAASLLWLSALGFGLPCLPAIRNVLTGRPVPTMLGFPAYGGGPFERHGIHSTVWPLAARSSGPSSSWLAGATSDNRSLDGRTLWAPAE
jgi:hypothetical protein